jgi:hypothetical protein
LRSNQNVNGTEAAGSMAERQIIYWRDIPAQVIVRRRRDAVKRELSVRFIQAIDRCAMVSGAQESAAYLAEWRKSPAEACSDDLAAEADALAAALERDFDEERLKALVANHGRAV